MTGNVETPFYMSKWQYARMQSMAADTFGATGSGRKRIYALFRVYGMESGSIGFKLFVDPESARRRGTLAFEAEGWTVTAR